MPKVKLIAYTPNPEKVIAASAKLCYSKTSAEDLYEGLTEEKAEGFVDMLSQIGHESPIEHTSFTFAIENVSRSLLAQITRHRIASFSVQSQRYVKIENFEFITPPEIEKIPKAKEIYLNSMKKANESYIELYKILKEKYKEEFRKEEPKVDIKEIEKKAEKKAIEDARYVLPNACETKMVCTMNARSLRNFFKLRCCNRAQWEIRDLATQMFKLVVEVAPNVFKNAGPSCVYGKCSEGKMSCKKQEEVRELFRSLYQGEK